MTTDVENVWVIALIAGVLVVVFVILALVANRVIVPKEDVDHMVPKPNEDTRTPLDLWGLPKTLKGIPRSTTSYLRVRKWMPLAMSFPLQRGRTGYIIRVLFPILIGLTLASGTL